MSDNVNWKHFDMVGDSRVGLIGASLHGWGNVDKNLVDKTWLCGCGALNSYSRDKCGRCGLGKW